MTLDETGPGAAATIALGGNTAGNDEDVAGAGPISRAVSGAAVLNVGPLYGADGQGTSGYVITVANAASGVTTTEGEAITLVQLNATTILGVVAAGGEHAGQVAFAIQINGTTGALTVEQYLSLDHPVNPNPNDPLQLAAGAITATATVTDGDGDPASSGAVDITGLITFLDDGPSAVVADAITAGLTNGTNDSATASLDIDDDVFNNFGADGGKVVFTNATITSLQGQNLKYNGVALEYAISAGGQLLTGYVDGNNNDTVDANETVFTIELQPGGSSNYTITMVQSLDTVQNIDFNGGGYNFVGGNGSWAGFTSGTNGDGVLDLLLTPMVNGANSSTMNTNANEGGVGSGNSISFGEGVRVDTVQDLQAVPAPTPSGDYGTLANQNHVFGQHENVLGISAVISTVNGPPGSTTNITMIARDESVASDANDYVGDGTQEAITAVVITHGAITTTVLRTDGLNQNVVVDGISYNVVFGAMDATVNGVVEGTRIGAATADGFDSLEFRNVGGQEFKIGDFNTIAITNGPIDFTVPISVVDGDGDTVSSGNLAIHADPVPPVVLDMDGDGVEFLGLDAGVHYDYGAGLVATAWVGADDAILVRDANGDGTVTDASEFVFGGNGVTDMEALHAQYGEQLDASDADFTMFALWTDANSNGVVDTGEMQSLAEAGVVSIGLVSDGASYTAANGDVAVAGSSTYTMADGSTGTAADAAFATGAARTQEVERIAANSNTTVLAAAVAAAGMAASAAAASPVDTQNAAHSNAVVSVESISVAADLASTTSVQALAASFTDAAATVSVSLGDQATLSSDWHAPTGDIGQSTGLESAFSALAAGTDVIESQMALPAMATTVAMPTAEAIMALENSPAATIDTVEQILVDALAGGGVNQIDTLMNALPDNGNGGIAQIDSAASGLHGLVPTWDMGGDAGFTPAVPTIITAEAMMLHVDAIQPVANG
nr:DUF5801 repeats-in-toxin domain-containing protein [Sphingomonas sp. HDW15A]